MNLFTKFYFFKRFVRSKEKYFSFWKNKLILYFKISILYIRWIIFKLYSQVNKIPHNPSKFKNSYQYLKNIDNIEVKN